jgi:hypothetical protein
MTSAIVSVSRPAPPSCSGETELRELGQKLEGERTRFAPLLGVRRDAAAREVAHRALDRELIVAVVEPH